jgi:hypothetical protein
MRVFCLCFLASAALACLPANAQKLKIEPNQQYLLLATKQTSTMQEELSEAAKQGFRIVVGSPTSGTEMVLLLERVAQPPETYSYRLLATTRTGTMQKELNEAAREGFRLLPRTMIEKAGSGMFALGKDGPKEIVAVLERAPKPDRFYEYKLLATSLTSTLQQEIAQAVAAGFALAGLVSRGEHMVIMEKEAPAQ